MSCDLVLEILCDQIPLKTMSTSISYIGSSIVSGFNKYGISCDSSRTFVSPNRLTFIASGVKGGDIQEIKEIKGPRVSASESAISGFLRKVGKNSTEDLETRNIDGVDFYYSTPIKKCVDELSNTVSEVIQNMIDKFPLHKKMKWGSNIGEWVRPVLNVACVLGSKIIPVEVAGVKANDLTYGNVRFLKTSYKIESISGYLSFLTDNMVVVDQEKRMGFILDQINSNIAGSSLSYNKKDPMLEELNGIFEYPRVFIGNIGERFVDLPVEVILCVLTRHQRYLAIYDSAGKIVKFASVASVVNDRVISTHEMVLSARLSDATFLMEKDRKHHLKYYVGMLSKIVFKKNLGTVLDKVNRISALAKYTSVWIPHASMLNVEKAAVLAKADLATLMVREFPELQGTMGRYYAKWAGEDEEVCVAIEEHYSPNSKRDVCPSSPVSVAVSLADKIDSLVGLMSTEEVTGSRDPFALRRIAISIIRIIMENGLYLPLNLLISKAVSLHYVDVKRNKSIKGLFGNAVQNNTASDIFNYFLERLKVVLEEEKIDKDIVDVACNDMYDLMLIRDKAKAIGDYIKTEKGKKVLGSYRRIRNIIPKNASLRERKIIKIKCNPKLCFEDCEINLHNHVRKIEKVLPQMLKSSSFEKAMDALCDLSDYVDKFLDGVRVNDERKVEIYRNRLNLSVLTLSLYNSVANFGKIQKEV